MQSDSPPTANLSRALNRSHANTDKLYSPLLSSPTSRYIRVFEVEATHNCIASDAIRGQLREVDLLDHPKFAAFSYVWGTFSIPRHTTTCGHHSIEITTNCWSALWHLRKALGSFTIWIDSISINQEDEEEKANQITLMGEIYSNAGPAYMWLGEDSLDSDRAIDVLKTTGFQHFLVAKNESEYYIPADNAFIRRLAWRTHFFRETKRTELLPSSSS